MSWSSLPPLQQPRAGHSATVLADGRVLIAGGGRRERAEGPCDEHNVGSLREVELFEPDRLRFVPAAAMHAPREGHAAMRLPDGGVLVAGGMVDLV